MFLVIWKIIEYNLYDDNRLSYFYETQTWNEYSNNKILIENHQEFKRTLNLCIAFIYAIAELLENFQDRFNIVLSVNDDDFVVKFYCVRDSEG